MDPIDQQTDSLGSYLFIIGYTATVLAYLWLLAQVHIH